MDEPFVGLDPKASHLLKGMMREVCDAGGAIFFSTHVLEVAEKLCDKVAIIKGGKLIRSGTIFAILQLWLYTDLLWVGAFGCLLAALNLGNAVKDEQNAK